jgi:hypothetical protein
MRIRSADIPQADVLDEVVNAILAVSSGAHSFEEIAQALGKVERQGRYYRRAGEILGFLHNEHGQNSATLTPAGEQFVANPEKRDELLAGAVMKSRLIQRVLPFFEAAGEKGVTRQQLQDFIANVTETVGASLIPRRVSTVVSWLQDVGMLKDVKDRYALTENLPQGVKIIEYDAPDEPLSPKKYDLAEYNNVAEKVKQAEGYINAQIDAVAKERADGAHQLLTNIVATKIRNARAIPKQNRYIDLSTVFADELYLFEMKSTTDANVHSQIRKAVSQLYEYRYIQQVPDAKLVVVIENPLAKDKQWLVDYVVNDRALFIVWDGDKNLHCPDQLKTELKFLVQ